MGDKLTMYERSLVMLSNSLMDCIMVISYVSRKQVFYTRVERGRAGLPMGYIMLLGNGTALFFFHRYLPK